MANKPVENENSQTGLVATSSADELTQANDLPESFRDIAHELRTPISTIIAFAEMIEREQFGPIGDERYRAYARDIQETARLTLSIVATGLDRHAKPTDLLDGSTSDVEFTSLAGSLLRIFEGAAREAEVELSYQTPQAPVSILTDEASLKQILLNLIGNAIKFTPPGGAVTLKVTINESVEIVVSDTGLGMTAADINILLGTKTRDASGAASDGIGFSLVRRLCTAIDAQLRVTSTRGLGTSVTLVFDRSKTTE